MADKSKFVLRWEVDESDPGLATGKVESRVFEEGEFKWILAASRVNGDVELAIHCGVNHNRAWKCKGEVEIRPIGASGSRSVFVTQIPFCFNEKSCSWQGKLRYSAAYMTWNNWSGGTYKINGKITMEFHILIINSESELVAAPCLFDAPNNRSDVILLIRDKKVYVSKELLAVHSPVFEALFFGNFAENGKEEIELKDLVYEEFIDFLHLIYVRKTEITDCTVLHILKLADRFRVEHILDLSKKYLMEKSCIDFTKKILAADQYGLIDLRDRCIARELASSSATELIEKLRLSPEFDKFSSDLKAAIFGRMVKGGR